MTRWEKSRRTSVALDKQETLRARSGLKSRETSLGADNDRNNDKSVANMLKMIVEAVDEGRESDLTDAGLKVRKRTAREIIDSNMSDEKIVEKVLGSMNSEEEVDIARALTSAQQDMPSRPAPAGIPDDLLADLKNEAIGVVEGQSISVLAQELGVDDEDLGIRTKRNRDKDGSSDVLSPVGGSEGTTILEKGTPEVDLVDAIRAENQGIEDLNKEAEERAGAEEEARRQLAVVSSPKEAVVPARIIAMAAAEDARSLDLSEQQQQSAQDTFGKLLKASMEEAEVAGAGGDIPEEVKRRTIDAVSQGDLESLDVKDLVGDTMAMLTERLGINMTAELSDVKSQGDMQAIIAGGMSELASNMKELDEKSEELYQQLGSLEQELRAETEAFNEKKSDELQELLGKQAAFQKDVEASRVKVEASAAQLQGLMADLEDKADVMTALALFPVKRVDKKMAFILGLGALFKSIYNLSELFAIRSTDPSDWLDLTVQLGLVFVFFSHYGLVKALSNPAQDLSLPPPPGEAEA